MRLLALTVSLALGLAACSGSAEDGAADAGSDEAETSSVDGADDGEASETPEESDHCAFLSFEEGNETSLALLALEVADDAISLDGEPASRFDRTIARNEISSISTSPVDGLGDKAVVHGGPPPNAVAVVVGDTFVELVVNDGELVGPGTVESLAGLVLERL